MREMLLVTDTVSILTIAVNPAEVADQDAKLALEKIPTLKPFLPNHIRGCAQEGTDRVIIIASVKDERPGNSNQKTRNVFLKEIINAPGLEKIIWTTDPRSAKLIARDTHENIAEESPQANKSKSLYESPGFDLLSHIDAIGWYINYLE